jgi:hypothetical protein
LVKFTTIAPIASWKQKYFTPTLKTNLINANPLSAKRGRSAGGSARRGHGRRGDLDGLHSLGILRGSEALRLQLGGRSTPVLLLNIVTFIYVNSIP